MYARSVDDAGARLRELGRRGWESLGVGVAAFGLALGATQAYPPLAVPLFVGGLVLLASGVRAIWRHWDLLDWLADERDAYVIPEVLARARRETTTERRRTFAADVRSVLTHAAGYRPRADVAEELEALAAELDDPGLVLDPACAVACMRLLSDPGSPLFDPAACDAEVQGRIARIRAGFSTRERGGTADARAADGEPLYV
jgi:hypothetical protein